VKGRHAVKGRGEERRALYEWYRMGAQTVCPKGGGVVATDV